MLRAALDRAQREQRLSIRKLGQRLGYKQATVLSHMATGRVLVPLERAADLHGLIPRVEDKKQAAAAAEARAKQAAIEEAAKKANAEKFAPVIKAKAESLAKLKATATKTPSGLQYVIVEKGSGKKPVPGSTMYIHYAGYLEDGSLFDSSMEEVNKTFGKFDQMQLLPLHTSAL